MTLKEGALYAVNNRVPIIMSIDDYYALDDFQSFLIASLNLTLLPL